MTLPLFVVNLERQPERRRCMEAQLAALPPGFRVEFVTAVDGKNLPPETLSREADHTIARATAGRDLNPGEIGCALSHRGIYRRMLEVGEPHAVVLEDDIAIGEWFPEVCLALARAVPPDRPRIVLLGDFFVPSIWKRRLGPRHALMRAWRGRSTTAYFCTNAAAQALNEAQTPVRRAADWWPDMERHGIIETWGVQPACVITGLFNRYTGIGTDRAQPPILLTTRLFRKWQTFWFQCTSWRP